MEKDISVIILDKNENSKEILKNYLKEFSDKLSLYFFDSYEEGLSKIKEKSDENPIVIIDMSCSNEELTPIMENAKLFSSRIIMTSNDCSTNTIIKALKAGAVEFLPKPILKEDLIRVITVMAQERKSDSFSRSKIIAVYSNKGGIGKTTIAVNLAIELAKVTGEKTALIDLNLQLGDISTFLNLNPAFDVNYVIRNIVNKNESSISEAFEKYRDTSLYVLSDPNYIEQAEGITPQQITALFSALRKTFNYIVVDMSSNIDANTLKILDLSDWILFTSIVNIPAIRNCQRCLNLFRSRRYPDDKVKIIINRFMENDEIRIEDIENTLGEKIYQKIPNNYFTVMEAINKGTGVTEINPNSNVSVSFRDFASRVSDDIIEQTVIRSRK